jgi:8-oxo-dGTP pyrophosphatase MutT (NUDIX family)
MSSGVDVREVLTSWEVSDDKAKLSKASALRFLDASADPFSREASNEHFTASAVVLSTAGVLMHRHKLNGIWVGPGGHVDAGERPEDAVVREVMEETGVAAWHGEGGARVIHVDCHLTANDHVHHDLRFLLLAQPDEPNPGEGESPDVGWFGAQEALAMTDETFGAAIRVALDQDVQLP